MQEEREQVLLDYMEQYIPGKIPGELINQALTHRSFAFEAKSDMDNERLEFLGDSIIGFEVSAFLYEFYSQDDEGQLSRQKAAIVGTSVWRISLARRQDALSKSNALNGPLTCRPAHSQRSSMLGLPPSCDGVGNGASVRSSAIALIASRTGKSATRCAFG